MFLHHPQLSAFQRGLPFRGCLSPSSCPPLSHRLLLLVTWCLLAVLGKGFSVPLAQVLSQALCSWVSGVLPLPQPWETSVISQDGFPPPLSTKSRGALSLLFPHNLTDFVL